MCDQDLRERLAEAYYNQRWVDGAWQQIEDVHKIAYYEVVDAILNEIAAAGYRIVAAAAGPRPVARDGVCGVIDNAIAAADLAANGAYTHLTGMYTEHVINGLTAMPMSDVVTAIQTRKEQRNDHDN